MSGVNDHVMTVGPDVLYWTCMLGLSFILLILWFDIFCLFTVCIKCFVSLGRLSRFFVVKFFKVSHYFSSVLV